MLLGMHFDDDVLVWVQRSDNDPRRGREQGPGLALPQDHDPLPACPPRPCRRDNLGGSGACRISLAAHPTRYRESQSDSDSNCDVNGRHIHLGRYDALHVCM